MIFLTVVGAPDPSSDIRGVIRRTQTVSPPNFEPLIVGHDAETLACGMCDLPLAVGVDPESEELNGVVFECPACHTHGRIA